MKTLFPHLSRITLDDWLEFHPYGKEVSSDHFYLELGNDLQHEILLIDVEDNFVGGDYKYLACTLVCYLEDIASQTGLWTSFIDEHYRLYGKYLPFYDMTGYERGSINLADIQFLIWHFCSNLHTQSHFIDPFSIENTEIANFVHTMLNEAAINAPRNEDMNDALLLPPDTDINKIRGHLEFLFFKCYYNQYYMTTLMEEEIIDVKNRKYSSENYEQLIENRRKNILFNRVSPFLARSSGEMLAHRVGETHPLYRQLMTLSKHGEGLDIQRGILKREEECFLEITGDKRLAFLESKREAFSFIDKVWELYHLKYGMDVKNRKLFDVHRATFDVDDDLENLTVFLNLRTGMEFYANISQGISISGNQYFDENAETDIERLILDEKVSSDFILFLIENKMIEIESISGKSGYNYVWANCDFLLRYWKKERYRPEPVLFID